MTNELDVIKFSVFNSKVVINQFELPFSDLLVHTYDDVEINSFASVFKALYQNFTYSFSDNSLLKTYDKSGVFFKTSGSTGESQIVFVPSADVLKSNEYCKHKFKFKKTDVALVVMKSSHIGAYTVASCPILESGGTVIFCDPNNVHNFYTAYSKYKPSVVHCNPNFLNLLETSALWSCIDMSHVDMLFLGGSAVFEKNIAAFKKKGAKGIYIIYGLTQACPPLFIKDVLVSQASSEASKYPALGCATSLSDNISIDENKNMIVSAYGKTINTNDQVLKVNDQYYYLGRSNMSYEGSPAVYQSEIEKFFSDNAVSNSFFVYDKNTRGQFKGVLAFRKSLFKNIASVKKFFELYPRLNDCIFLSNEIFRLPNGKLDYKKLLASRYEHSLKNLDIETLSDFNSEQFKSFISDCNVYGLVNNNFDFLLNSQNSSEEMSFWILKDSLSKKIVGMSGCQKFDFYEPNTVRVLFNSFVFPDYRGRGSFGLNPHGMNSIPFNQILPYQIQWGLSRGYNKFVISINTTTEKNNDYKKINQLINILQKKKLISFIDTRIIDGDLQNIYQLEIEKINSLRNKGGFGRLF